MFVGITIPTGVTGMIGWVKSCELNGGVEQTPCDDIKEVCTILWKFVS